MNSNLKILFEFQYLIAEMQQRVIEMRMRGVSQETLQPAIVRIDKLVEVYKSFDKFYYSAHYNAQKILELESTILLMAEKISELEKENDKLLKTIKWN